MGYFFWFVRTQKDRPQTKQKNNDLQFQFGMSLLQIWFIPRQQESEQAKNKQYRDLRENVIDQVGQAFDDYIDKLERATDKIESLQKVTETYKNIIDIVGKKILDPTGKVTKALDEATFKQFRNLTKSTKATLDFSEKALADAKATRDELAKQ